MLECGNWLFLFAPFCYIMKYFFYAMGALIIFGLIAALLFAKCPNCKSRSIADHRRVVGNVDNIEDVKKEAILKDKQDNFLVKVETTQKELVTRKEVEKWCKCKSCGHIFNKRTEII